MKMVVIYTIGAGAEGLVPAPVFDYAGKRTGTEMRESEIDSLLLRDVAESTGGLFFRATDANAVRDAFARIDEAQKIEFAASPPLVSRELFHLFALIGVALLVLRDAMKRKFAPTLFPPQSLIQESIHEDFETRGPGGPRFGVSCGRAAV